MIDLHSIAKKYNWEPQAWHFRLSRGIPAMAIMGIFKAAECHESPCGTEIKIDDWHKAEMARRWQPEIDRAFGIPVSITLTQEAEIPLNKPRKHICVVSSQPTEEEHRVSACRTSFLQNLANKCFT